MATGFVAVLEGGRWSGRERFYTQGGSSDFCQGAEVRSKRVTTPRNHLAPTLPKFAKVLRTASFGPVLTGIAVRGRRGLEDSHSQLFGGEEAQGPGVVVEVGVEAVDEGFAFASAEQLEILQAHQLF